MPVLCGIFYPHGRLPASVNFYGRLPALADNPHPKTKENRRFAQSSFIVFVDMISFSVHLMNFHTFCLRCFIENDITCKNVF